VAKLHTLMLGKLLKEFTEIIINYHRNDFEY